MSVLTDMFDITTDFSLLTKTLRLFFFVTLFIFTSLFSVIAFMLYLLKKAIQNGNKDLQASLLRVICLTLIVTVLMFFGLVVVAISMLFMMLVVVSMNRFADRKNVTVR